MLEKYDVLDSAALATYLGYTKSTVLTHVTRKRWDKVPEPSKRLAMGPVWYLGDVQQWQRKKGLTPPKDTTGHHEDGQCTP